MSDNRKTRNRINHGAPLGVAAMDNGLTKAVKAFTKECPIGSCTQYGKGSPLCLDCTVYKRQMKRKRS